MYLHSCDAQFTAIGARSGINYQKLFNQFKEIITKKSAKDEYKTLFAFFNQRVFHWIDSESGAESSGVDEAIAAALEPWGLDDPSDGGSTSWDNEDLEVCLFIQRYMICY